jgi:hypothetical protein
MIFMLLWVWEWCDMIFMFVWVRVWYDMYALVLVGITILYSFFVGLRLWIWYLFFVSMKMMVWQLFCCVNEYTAVIFIFCCYKSDCVIIIFLYVWECLYIYAFLHAELQSCFALLQLCVQAIAIVPSFTISFLNHILPRLTYYSPVKMEATPSSKTLVRSCRNTRCHTTRQHDLLPVFHWRLTSLTLVHSCALSWYKCWIKTETNRTRRNMLLGIFLEFSWTKETSVTIFGTTRALLPYISIVLSRQDIWRRRITYTLRV